MIIRFMRRPSPMCSARGWTSPVRGVDNGASLFGDVVEPDVVVFHGGNQVMTALDLM